LLLTLNGADFLASSRADLFEESVQNAMEEATSDDSDETFVYESNPPDTNPRKPRHHSRTPSGASLASASDSRGIIRSLAKALEQQRPVPKARSMKFASNNSNYVTPDEDTDGRDTGTIRAGRGNGNSIHHHLGRPTNRHGNGGPSSILDEENPLFPVGKTRTLTTGLPRAAILAAQQLRNTSIKRDNGYSSLDMEDEAADDEQTPLIHGTIRTRGSRTSRQSRLRREQLLHQQQGGNRSRTSLARFVGCLLILTTVSVLAFGVLCFLFALSKPLAIVQVKSLKSVIATEQELMFDISISAVNPNLVPVTVTELDVNLFAKSKYVGSDRWWREHGNRPHTTPWEKRDAERIQRKNAAKDPVLIADPPPQPGDPSNYPTMLLGQVLHFDSPLSFDGSFWRRQNQSSTGSLRLSNPGNKSEYGGSKRWEIVLEHDFQLIVRGVLHYDIPLGGTANRVPICGYTFVKGSTGSGDDEDDLETLEFDFDPTFPGDSPCEI
jgi:Vacuolar segregation subunit 7